MLNRRTVLSTAALGTAAALALRNRLAFALPENDPYRSNLGLQLYTVRNEMAVAPSATLAAIKAAGYAQVEMMDVMDADVLVPLAHEHGLNVTSSFIAWNLIGQENAENIPTLAMMMDKATKHGLKHLVFGYIGRGSRETADQYKAMSDRANVAAEKCLTANLQLCYHNHSFEFQPLTGGQTGFDIFIERFDAKLMKFELDVFWAALGGWDPVQTLQRLDQRVTQVHLKDLKAGVETNFDEGKVPVDAFQEVGDGVIDIAAVIQKSREIGVEQCHVEQDQSPSPLKSIEQSAAYLAGLKVS